MTESTTKSNAAKTTSAQNEAGKISITPKPSELAAKVQSDALKAVKSYHAATVAAVRVWTDAVSKVASVPPVVPAEVRAAFGDSSDLLDSNYDFATKVLELNKQFAHQLADVTAPAVASEAKSTK